MFIPVVWKLGRKKLNPKSSLLYWDIRRQTSVNSLGNSKIWFTSLDEDIEKYIQIAPDIEKYIQIAPDIEKYIQIAPVK